MSIWYEIDDLECVDYDKELNEIHILYKTTNMGNHYVSGKADLIKKVLEDK